MRKLGLVLMAFVMCWSSSAMAQTSSAAISGRVVDNTGAVVVGAQVTVTNIDMGTSSATSTNGEGFYLLPGLKPGRYRIAIKKEGFRQIVKTEIELHVQDVVAENFKLDVGAVSEAITVRGDEVHINTEDASVSTVVDQTYVQNMPLNGRSFQDLILLTPGVVTQTPQFGALSNRLGTAGEFSVSGQRTEENYYTVDGVSANVGAAVGQNQISGAGPTGSLPGATALGTTQALVSVDDLQEFRVQTSSYSAEYGRNPGGQFAFETKSGTNQWHGTAYDYLRNGFFDAQDWFSDYLNTPQPALRQNDFGGTLSGPVRFPHIYNGRDKTFFFVSYEGLRLAQPQPPSIGLIVPDDALRQSTPLPLQPVINAFPIPNGMDFNDGTAQYIATWSNPSSIDSASVRFDHVVKEKHRLFFRFSDTSSNSATRGSFNFGNAASVNTISESTIRTYTAGVTSLFSNRISNDFRLNYTSNEITQNDVVDPIGGSQVVNLLQLSGLSAGATAVVDLAFGSGFGNFLRQAHQSGAQKQWNFVDTIGLSFGRHQLKFGADYRRLTPSAVLVSPLVVYFFRTPSDVQSNNAQIEAAAQSPAYPLYKNFSAFAQDQWRVSGRLNLSLGLRWEVNPPPGAARGLMPYTLQGSGFDTMAVAPQGTPLWKTTWFNFAPRLGAAYTIRDKQGWETVLRGGGGVFFDTGQQQGSQGFQGPGFQSQNFCPGGQQCPSNPAFPVSAPALVLPIQNPPQSVGGSYDANPYGFSPHLQLPYTLQWNVSVEQALGKAQALTVSYIGSHASRLLQTNLIFPSANPNTSSFTLIQNGGVSSHEALETQFNRRLSSGLTALASYTFSHCIDEGSTNSLFGYLRADCDFDVRHNFSAAFSYDLPNISQNRLLNAIVHHWGLDNWITARTAFPLNVGGNEMLLPDGKLYEAGADFVPNQPAYLSGANCAQVLQGLGELGPGQGCPGGRALNPNAFIPVSTGYGNVPRNFARLFGAWQMNFGIRREFPIHERLKLQFRAEAFNIFNHPNFGFVDSFIGDSTFGLALNSLAAANDVLSSVYASGGARSMQFALKLVF